MPQLDRVDQLPLPNLNLYVGLSSLALFYTAVYAFTSAQSSFFSMVWSDVWCSAAVLNMSCCFFFLFTKFIYSVIFGKLQNIEHQHMRDKFWNFVFYKFIFVFGVMNVQEVPEMLCWCVWFAVLGTLSLTEQLCKDRFQLLSYSPNTPTSSHAKVILLLSFILLSCAGLFMVCAIVGWQYGFNHFTFLYSEVFILFARTLHSIIKHILHLWDMHHDGVSENRSTYIYYVELVLEVAVLGVDFMHHVHMLLWANMFLSVASLILLMKLRFLYQEIQRRLKRHHNYMLVSNTLENRFELVPSQDLLLSDETCAICWEKMRTACRLPCRHLFHRVCLRAWLEQDTVCPTCRLSLSEDLRQGREGNEGQEDQQEQQQHDRGRVRRNMRNARNWLLRFNGASIASWLPTFSLELHQEDNARWVSDAAELHRVAQQIHSMFPHVPIQAITLDLADTHSTSLTVDRILNDSIYIPMGGGGAEEEEGILPAEHGEDSLQSSRRGSESVANTVTLLPHTNPQQSHDMEQSVIEQSDPLQSRDLDQWPHGVDQGPGDHDQQSHDHDRQSHDSDVQSRDADGSICPDEVQDSLNALHSRTLLSPHEPHSTSDAPPPTKSPPLSELRQRKPASEAAESTKVAKAGEKAASSSSSGDQFQSSDGYSRLFSSMQERKAELLRRAKRNYLSKEDA